jgi:hypothetical protein
MTSVRNDTETTACGQCGAGFTRGTPGALRGRCRWAGTTGPAAWDPNRADRDTAT